MTNIRIALQKKGHHFVKLVDLKDVMATDLVVIGGNSPEVLRRYYRSRTIQKGAESVADPPSVSYV